MLIQQFGAWILSLVLWLGLPLAQTPGTSPPPPPSFSNIQLFERDFSGQQLRMAEFEACNLTRAKFVDADLRGAVFSNSRAKNTDFHGADLSYSVIDLTDFTNANFRDVVFVEAVLLRSTVRDMDIAGADFTGAILDGLQAKEFCEKAEGVNPKTGVATRDSLGC
jgi:uncharacterized protein YjbI with pentapeptide repeats